MSGGKPRTLVYGTFVAVAVLLLSAGAIWFLQVREGRLVPERLEDDTVAQGAATDERVRVSSPRPNDVVSSPLTVRGEARGQWYFEADFPVRLLDGDGREFAVAPALWPLRLVGFVPRIPDLGHMVHLRDDARHLEPVVGHPDSWLITSADGDCRIGGPEE